MAQAYSNQQLYNIAGENYQVLDHFCELLSNEGYWEQPEKILKLTAKELLDIYVQSLLVCFAVYCNNFHREERYFIAALSDYAKQTFAENPDTETILSESEHFLKTPPILFQLLSLRDMERNSGYAGLFFDALLNIMLCLSYLNGKREASATRYFGEYFDKVGMFLQNNKNSKQAVDSKYIFKKLCYGKLEQTAKELMAVDGNFEEYKKRHLFYREEQEAGLMSAYLQEADGMQEHREMFSGENAGEEDDLSAWERNREDGGQKDELDRYDDMAGEDDWKEEGQEDGEADDDLAGERNQEDKREEDWTGISKDGKKQDGNLSGKKAEDAGKQDQKTDLELLDAIHADRLAKLLEELDGLVGLSEVKTEIHSLINLIKIRKMREKYGLPEIEMSYHMVFTGSPGTGKTTVARLVGKIYKELGILSKGEMTETDRSGLVAGYVGQTALKVKEVVEKALGGILFIDEAYALVQNIGNDFGTEAIETLVKMMEDHRDDFVVIVAGYTEEMKQFLKSNTGLMSRFNRFITFPDYSREELWQILGRMAGKAGMALEEDVKELLFTYLSGMSAQETEEFGNARGIRNLFEKMVVNQANRLVSASACTVEELTLLKGEDISWLAQKTQ